MQSRNTTEDVGQEAKLLERKLLLCKDVLLTDVETGLCLLLLQPTNTKERVDVLRTHCLTQLTKAGNSLRQGSTKLRLPQLLLRCVLR